MWMALLEIEMRGEPPQHPRRSVHVVAVADLGGTAVAAAVMRDNAKPLSSRKSICASQSSQLSGQP